MCTENSAERCFKWSNVLVWRDFQALRKHLVDAALDAIGVVAKMSSVYVLDIHGLTFLFEFQTFQKVMVLLTPSSVIVINLEEDEGTLDSRHISLIASKILDGSSSIRHWFVECQLKRE